MYLFSASVIKKYGKPTSLYCPKTTAINKGYKYKDVLLVPTDKAIRFDYINNKW